MTSNEERRFKRYQKRVKKRRKQRDLAVGKNDNFEEAIHPDRLFDSFHECQKDVSWKASVQSCHYDLLFRITDIEECGRSHQNLRHGFVCFPLIERGKLRKISSVHINERIPQRSLCDNVLAPVCFRSITYNNGASVKGAGIRRAEEQLIMALLAYYRKFGTTVGYIVLFDVHGYFDSIQHKNIEDVIANFVWDPDSRKLFNEFTEAFDEIHDDEHQGVGVGLGSQVSQISGVMGLNPIDHYICEMLSEHVFSSGRYMDDSRCITRTKEDALFIIRELALRYAHLGYELNMKKTVILPLNKPFIWLKKKYILKDTGRVRVVLTGATIKRERKNLRKYLRWLKSNRVTEVEVKSWYVSWRKSNQFYDSARMLNKMDVYYEQLFGQYPAMKLQEKDKKRKIKRDPMQIRNKIFQQKHPECIVILKNDTFYSARGIGALILAELTGYKLHRYIANEYRCTFRQQSIKRVLRLLNQCQVNYVIYQEQFMISNGKYPENQYARYAEKYNNFQFK